MKSSPTLRTAGSPGHPLRKHLLLVGAGHAHLHVLEQLAQHRPSDLDVTLLTPDAWQTYSGMVPGYVAGRYPLSACRIDVPPLLVAAGVRWLQGRCTGIDAARSEVRVQPAAVVRAFGDRDALEPANTSPTEASARAPLPDTLPYDFLSLDTGAVFDPQRLEADMPGALQHTLPVRPIDGFAAHWDALAQRLLPGNHTSWPTGQVRVPRPVTLAFVGGGAASLELAMAAHERLASSSNKGHSQQAHNPGTPQVQVVLVTGDAPAAAGYASGVQQRVLRQLQHRGMRTVAQRCVGAQAGALLLADGSQLACDAAVLAVGTHAPRWLQGSGLALTDTGHLAVNRFQQSTSHANVFAAGDVASRVDAPHPKSGVYAVRAGPALVRNLLAATQGQALSAYQPPQRTLNLLSCGTHHAILSWGPLHTEGGWAWRLKDAIDRKFVARYTLP